MDDTPGSVVITRFKHAVKEISILLNLFLPPALDVWHMQVYKYNNNMRIHVFNGCNIT